jgi:hypothetical protein
MQHRQGGSLEAIEDNGVRRRTPMNPEGGPMINSVEDFQKIAKDNAENAQKAFGTLSKGLQTIAAEITEIGRASCRERVS